MSNGAGGTEFVRPRDRHDATIRLAEADPAWAHRYAAQAALIRAALDDRAIAVEHVGSTAVSGLAAKPILDILLLVADPADEAGYVPDLEAAGFLLHAREPGWHEHRLLKRASPAVHLHVFAPGCPEAERLLLFRDRLRGSRQDRERYEQTKRELAARTWTYVQDYADAKVEVVEQILAHARTSRRGAARRAPPGESG
jgi:GrpB-like predicted nucleotidyltransferase (UPF0157 family)